MDNNSIHITIFTPTYNRASLLFNLYESLLGQTYKNFEWVVETAANYAIEKALSSKDGADNLTWGEYIKRSSHKMSLT